MTNFNESIESNFPKLHSAYTRAENELRNNLERSVFKPDGWEFPNIRVDVKNDYPPIFSYSKNEIVFSGKDAIRMSEEDIYIYLSNTIKNSQRFPSIYLAYEEAIDYTLKNLHTIPDRRKDWQPPQLVIGSKYPASYDVYNNRILYSLEAATKYSKDAMLHTFKHEIRHSLNKPSIIEKILSPTLVNAVRYSPLIITAATAIASKIFGGEYLNQAVAFTALATTALTANFLESIKIILPYDYVTSSRGRKTEIECDRFATSSVNDIMGAITRHYKGRLGETTPNITNLSDAEKACAEFYLMPELRKPKPPSFISELKAKRPLNAIVTLFSISKPQVHPIAGERVRRMIEELKNNPDKKLGIER
ncbi:MAG: hypothetical protein SFT90_01310 [Rickettsiales bacterium]|nr:hypothetical protein [Rickettsiales bacterium]